MLIDISCLEKANVKIHGVLHIGAHLAEEEPIYRGEVGLNNDAIIWVEANPIIVNELLEKDPTRIVYQALISDKIETVPFYITNNGQSSSLLKLHLHKEEHPWVIQTNVIHLTTNTGDNLFLNEVVDKRINMINLDIQGAELLALKGMDKILHYIDIIYTEVNIKELYKDCALINEIDDFLGEGYGFVRVVTKMTEHGWGDAIYLKRRYYEITHNKSEALFWDKIKPQVNVMFDVGARNSIYPYFTATSTFHLFDPNPDHYRQLMIDFGSMGNVMINKLALGSIEKESVYYPKSESIILRSFSGNVHYTIDQIRLEKYCKKKKIDSIDFLKIDTEGYEYEVLLGAGSMLQKTRIVQFEYGGTYPEAGITLGMVYELLCKNGFRYFYLLSDTGLISQPYPIEHQQYSNYVALRETISQVTLGVD